MSSELEKLRQAIEDIWAASGSTGLDPFPIHFEIVPAAVMYEVGAYGLPGRFSHWTHGKAFHQMKTMYDYGLSKIYELIINTNPAQAFLMEGNSLIQNKLVIAHVIGHCLAPGTEVVTDSGFQAIERIQPGQRVLNGRGEWTQARPTSRPYHGPLIRVLAGGQSCAMTPEHRLLAVQPDKGSRGKQGWLPYLNNAEPSWVEARDLSSGDFLVVRIPTIGKGTRTSLTIPYVSYAGKQAVRARPEFEFPLNEETGELIGYFLAEGCVHSRGLIGFGFHTDETSHHQRVRELMVRYWGVNVGEDTNPKIHSHTVRCNSKQIAQWLIQQFGQHDPCRHLPQCVLEEAPEEFLRGVLRGYMNGDGAKGKYQISYDATSAHLAQQIQQIALHFGIYLGLHQRVREGRLRVFSATASGQNMRALRDILGWPPPDPEVRGGTPNRVWSLSHRVGDYFYIRVTSVDTLEYEGNVYCLNVPGDSSFLLANHVVSHNSDFFKCNAYFQHTNRQMAEMAGVTAERVRAYEQAHGEKEVEEFLDAVLSIQEHIDPNLRVLRKPRNMKIERDPRSGRRTTEYDDLWLMSEKDETPLAPVRRKVPEEPEKDLLLFLLEYAPELEDWQRDVLNIVRDEMLYFLPQMQTKIMNEGWACATFNSLLITEHGILRFDRLYEQRQAIRVGSGGAGALHPITDFHKEEQVPTLRITTRRGYTIEGALKHRVQLADGSWAFLSDVKPGNRIALACGTEVWAREPVPIAYQPLPPDATLESVARRAGTSIRAVVRHLDGQHTLSAAAIETAIAETGYAPGRSVRVLPTRHALTPPSTVNEPLAHLLGYFVGDGNLTKSGICLTCGDEAYARRLTDLTETTLGIPVTLRDDRTETGPRWRIEAHSRELLRLLESLGVDLEARARDKAVPGAVLRSPRPVVAAFLSGYFDADAYAGPEGIILSSASAELIRTVQVVLLNFGILSTQRGQADGCVHLEIKGASAARFSSEIGFKLERKQTALRAYVDAHRWFKQENTTDEIVAIEAGCADVYDITVDVAHAYVANGFVNHNSYWHSRILREMDFTPEEHIEFTRLHSGVLSPSPRGTSINPYYVGFKIFEDIERRWNGDLTDDERKDYREANRGEWPHQGKGREKMFEVRELENDVSFLRNYLTRHMVDELDMYIYAREGDEWVVVEKDWRKIRDAIVESMTNFGFPYLVVEDGDYHRARELYLRHCFDERELDQNYGFKTLRYLHKLWGRPVHLETIVDEEPVVWTFDGEKELIEPKDDA